MISKTEFEGKIKELYGWYAAISIKNVCRIDILSLMHGCGKFVYNLVDSKKYFPINFVANRIENNKLLEVKAIEEAEWIKLINNPQNETEDFCRSSLIIPEDLCVWLNVYDLYDCAQTDLALAGEILGSNFCKKENY